APPSRPCCRLLLPAQDGIPACHVTGAQTCALPIWFSHSLSPPVPVPHLPGQHLEDSLFCLQRDRIVTLRHHGEIEFASHISNRAIGRASCRERAEVTGGGGEAERRGPERYVRQEEQ